MALVAPATGDLVGVDQSITIAIHPRADGGGCIAGGLGTGAASQGAGARGRSVEWQRIAAVVHELAVRAGRQGREGHRRQQGERERSSGQGTCGRHGRHVGSLLADEESPLCRRGLPQAVLQRHRGLERSITARAGAITDR